MRYGNSKQLQDVLQRHSAERALAVGLHHGQAVRADAHVPAGHAQHAPAQQQPGPQRTRVREV